jgi:RloB-like protein
MAKHPRYSKGKEIKPTFFVFCEGESEEAYISFVRSSRRISIQIKAKVAKNKINQKYVNRNLKPTSDPSKDKFFLLYDIDTPGMLDKLQSIKDAILLVSNPCFELWYILHTRNHSAEVNSQQCVEKLERMCKDYRKGYICGKLRHELTTGEEKAIANAKKHTLYNNPSTSVYLLIEELNKL